MTNLRNELPIAVHLASGGNARLRTGGQAVSLNGISSASVQASGATGVRGVLNARSTGSVLLLVGYSSPVTASNASWVISDLGEFKDDIPTGTTLYLQAVSSDSLSPITCGAHDYVFLSFYD